MRLRLRACIAASGSCRLVPVAHLLSVAASTGAVLRVVHLQEAAAERLDLLAHHGAHVVRRHHRAEVVGGLHRCQPRHAAAEHEDLGGRHTACRGHLAGEEAAERVGSLQHGKQGWHATHVGGPRGTRQS